MKLETPAEDFYRYVDPTQYPGQPFLAIFFIFLIVWVTFIMAKNRP